jgi:hypothetical protein
MLLALIVWIGGIIFFAFVMAPTLFSVLPVPLAGNVVSPTLTKLHWIGLFSGGIFLLCSLIYNYARHSQPRLFGPTHLLVVLMLILTAISQFAITPRMRELREGPSGLDAPNARADFNRLHMWSTRTEGGVLLLGLLVVIVTARERSH